jgi:hypothetical protein
MKNEEIIARINQVISDYFEHSTKEDSVAAKELMPDFIKTGIFTKDNKKGKPIRDVLRALDSQNDLAKIPSVHPERKEKNTFWYFVRTGSTYVPDSPNDTGVTKKQKARTSRAKSDEHYVINLCDELLHEKASRQHKFGFLFGDYHKDGRSRTALPVDAYYQEKNLVIEFMEKQHTEAVDFFDKPERMTISGVSRSEQRKKYDARRKDGLLANNIQLLEIDYSAFECDSDKKLIRDKEKDLKVLIRLLNEYM